MTRESCLVKGLTYMYLFNISPCMFKQDARENQQSYLCTPCLNSTTHEDFCCCFPWYKHTTPKICVFLVLNMIGGGGGGGGGGSGAPLSRPSLLLHFILGLIPNHGYTWLSVWSVPLGCYAGSYMVHKLFCRIHPQM